VIAVALVFIAGYARDGLRRCRSSAGIFLAYGLFGQYLPAPLDHRGYDFAQSHRPALPTAPRASTARRRYVSSTYIFLFILFGSLPRTRRHDPAVQRHRHGHGRAHRAAARPRCR
jgi:TRAP-type uncharacterized transport system fused permease subunit